MATVHVNRKEYWAIFLALTILTVLEVGLVKVPGIAKPMMITGLVFLAAVKAACVALFFMHLKHETRMLRLTVFVPLMVPPVYALVLIAEAAWRLLPQ